MEMLSFKFEESAASSNVQHSCPSCMSRMNFCRRSLWALGVLPLLEDSEGDAGTGEAGAFAGR